MGRNSGGRVPIWTKYRTTLSKIAIVALAAIGLAAAGIAILRNWSPPLFPSLFLVGIAVILLMWKLPKFQVARSQGLTAENRFDRENEARKTLAQILGGIFVLAGLYSSVQTLNLSREGQITDRFTKAIEQLGNLDGTGNPKLEVRLGGIYALERIARDSERDDWVIMEVLTAYVRAHSSSEKKGGEKTRMQLENLEPKKAQRPNADIQAILTVLSRRDVTFDRGFLDLRMTDLRGGDLAFTKLRNSKLSGADLSRANLRYADLNFADLSGADLSGADLSNAVDYGEVLSGEGGLRGGVDLRRGEPQRREPQWSEPQWSEPQRCGSEGGKPQRRGPHRCEPRLCGP
jgi:hypothetical protein